ncbi:increased DNA methylation 1 [Heracleum sosnowskyi]|uniref:Increased DNA methylation 1 n=1 Tax=Heracleum sosnowskyi TaxID=360622 RepID=A0AAD8M205_9APIA|nr:increased DNA methylation 1 [Heracleum sosnowskyi]
MEHSFKKHVVEAIINPQAVLDYYYNSDESGKSRGIKDIQMKAKQHLSAMGWRFYYIMKKDGKRELRYSPPNCKKKYISLRMACKGYLDSQSQFGLMSNNVLDSQVGKIGYDGLGLQSRITEVLGGTNVKVMESKKRRLSFGDVYGERMMICMKGNRDVVEEDDVFVQSGTLKEEQDCGDFYNDLFGDEDDENLNVGIGLGEKSFNDMHLSREKHQFSKKVKKRKTGVGKGGSRGKLAVLIKSKLILPLTKVYYKNRRYGSVMGEGRVTMEGIDCSCCKGVFTLTKFEAHVGSTYHRPAANIFVEDGRSLVQVEQQMPSVGKQVKGIKKKAKGINDVSIIGTDGKNRHDDFCLVCKETGELILCNQCTSAFHQQCLCLSEVLTGKSWYCASCSCKICGQICPKDGSEPTISCDQCEQQYHVKCLGECCVAEQERNKWFCSEKCKVISSSLGRLLGKTFAVGENNLSWTILRNQKNVIDVKTTKKLNLALAVMHECFESSKEPCNGRDVAEDVIFSRQSDMKRLDYRGFYTMILEKKAKVVTVATVRIFGDNVAEVPFIATRFKYRRQGLCKTLMDVLEEKLINLGIEKLVLPAIPSVVDTWTGPSFGFSKMTPYERSKLINYTLLNFPDTVTCQKQLAGSR